MKNGNTRVGPFCSLVVLTLLVLFFILILAYRGKAGNDIVSALKQVNPVCQEEELALLMVRESLVSEQGLIVQKLEGGYPSNYALLESMGQLLEYAVLAGDENLFAGALKVTFNSFKTREGYYAWRLDGGIPEKATALVDELRIIRVLSALDDGGKYDRFRTELTRSIYTYDVDNGKLVDFYDAKSRKTADRLSLFFIDVLALEELSRRDSRFDRPVDQAKNILRAAPQDEHGFFPAAYDYREEKYVFPSIVNMVENIHTAMNYLEVGGRIEPFREFLEQEIAAGRIYISYDRSGKPAVEAESAAVYALACQLFLKLREQENAEFCYQRMLDFQMKDEGILKGGFGDRASLTVYAFDQLEALKTIRMREGNR
jgi:hypothetical protein